MSYSKITIYHERFWDGQDCRAAKVGLSTKTGALRKPKSSLVTWPILTGRNCLLSWESTERLRNSKKNLNSSYGWSLVTGDICENGCQSFIRQSRLRTCFASFACVFSLPFFLLYPFGSLLVTFLFMFVLCTRATRGWVCACSPDVLRKWSPPQQRQHSTAILQHTRLAAPCLVVLVQICLVSMIFLYHTSVYIYINMNMYCFLCNYLNTSLFAESHDIWPCHNDYSNACFKEYDI